MVTHLHLPTYISAEWGVTALKDSLISTLRHDRVSSILRMYFYAVTKSGWDQIRRPILQWKRESRDRRVILVVGTDHAITEPAAVEWIQKEGVEVRLMLKYQGVFHPKVLWLQSVRVHNIWVGSNNLTRDGILNNIEFAILIKSSNLPADFRNWTGSVEGGSVPLTPELLDSYDRERKEFESRRVAASATTFVWSRKGEPKRQAQRRRTSSGYLIVQIMPRETGSEGKQLQLPVAAASAFFGIRGVGASKSIRLKAKGGSLSRALTMTVFGNNTVRLSISDLEVRDRPCLIMFRKRRGISVEYEIVSQNIFPSRYAELLNLCVNQTRSGSRRWGIT